MEAIRSGTLAIAIAYLAYRVYTSGFDRSYTLLLGLALFCAAASGWRHWRRK